MTRIIAGEFGGRRIAVPRGAATRPTADRVREAWMSILTPYLENAVVLDLFAGSGALGLEALSRGAASAVFVERGPAALELIRKNIDLLGVADRARLVKGDALRFVADLGVGAYDIAFADPPYGTKMLDRVIAAWQRTKFSEILVAEHAATHEVPRGARRKAFADTVMTIYEQ